MEDDLRSAYYGDASLLEEIDESDLVQGGWSWSWCCSTNTFSLSDGLGNQGGWCTLTRECQPNCN